MENHVIHLWIGRSVVDKLWTINYEIDYVDTTSPAQSTVMNLES